MPVHFSRTGDPGDRPGREPARRGYTRLAQELLQRIELNPELFQGEPTLRGRRIAVEHVLSMLAVGDTAADILAHYPHLEMADIQACIQYADRLVARETIELTAVPAL